MTNTHQGHRQRLRDRVQKEGLENFHDHEVLEYALSFVIPYKDTNPIAHALINQFGSLTNVLEASPEELQKVDGMGEVSATFISSLIKFHSKYELEKVKNQETIINPQDTFEYMYKLLGGKLIEEVYVVSLTPKSKVIRFDKISQGTQAEASVTIRLITDAISKNKSNNVIVGHNHPKGDIHPSEEDNRFTKALVTSLMLNGCNLLDHIIIGDNKEFFSYRISGGIDAYKQEAAKIFGNPQLLEKVAQKEAPYHYEINPSGVCHVKK